MVKQERREGFKDAESRVRAYIVDLTTVGIMPVTEPAKQVYALMQEGRFKINFDVRTHHVETPTAFKLIKDPFHPLDHRPAIIVNPKSLPHPNEDKYGYKDAFLSDLARSVAAGGRWGNPGITDRRQTFTDFATRAQLMMMEKYNVTELWDDPRTMDRQAFLQKVLGKAYWADMSINEMKGVVTDALRRDVYTPDEKDRLTALYQSTPHFLNVREQYTDYAYAIGISPGNNRYFHLDTPHQRARDFGWAVIEQITHRNREKLAA